MFHYKVNEFENKSKDNLILQLLDSCKAHGPFLLELKVGKKH